MATIESAPPQLGRPAPPFDLPATDGRSYSLDDFADARALLVMFICNHCPYVKAVQPRLITLADDFASEGLRVAAICSNDPVRYPADDFDAMKRDAERLGYPFPYLHDAAQEVATAYGAECTPDFFLFDADHRLAYRGRLDDSWRDPEGVTSRDLRDAIEALLEGRSPEGEQVPSMGCSIKWKY